MKIITWNINSVRLRLGLVLRLLAEESPDILCLQETKCPDDAFPHRAFTNAGYPHHAIRGEKGYNGVAIISRLPLTQIRHHDWLGRGDCRHQAVTVPLPQGASRSIDLHNFYVPAGGDVPDPKINPKFDHKLKFLDAMRQWSAAQKNTPKILLGDLNIAPLEDDVWSHKALLKIVSHTPIETQSLNAIMAAGGWVDTTRHMHPHGKLYSWWSYRARDWAASDRGRRLDHIWVTPPLTQCIQSATILHEVRGWVRPSDHAPVVLILAD